MDICICSSLTIDCLPSLDTTLGAMTPADLVGVIAPTIEYMIGIALNMHILLVYIGNLKNGLGPSDKVHLTKALVNGSLHLTMVAQNILYASWPHLYYRRQVFPWITIIQTLLMYYSYWLTALLCVYYCTNITSSGHPSVVWLKRSLSSHLLHIILVLGLGSFAISCPTLWILNIKLAGNSTDPSMVIQEIFLQEVVYRTTSSILGCFLPFTIALVSTAFTAWSLINHMWRMKQNNWGFTRSTFQTQINATRTMVLFLLISVIYGVTQVMWHIIPSNVPNVVLTITFYVIISYPISEAIVIIQSSSKFRKTLLGKIFDRKRRNSETET